MDYMKDGKKRSEFWPRQDLANDPAGQEQASKLARGAKLRIALGKVTDDKDLIQSLMRLWNGEKLEDINGRSQKMHDIFMTAPMGKSGSLQFVRPLAFPTTVTEDEKKLLMELRKLVVGL
jgi:hypothetical protein